MVAQKVLLLEHAAEKLEALKSRDENIIREVLEIAIEEGRTSEKSFLEIQRKQELLEDKIQHQKASLAQAMKLERACFKKKEISQKQFEKGDIDQESLVNQVSADRELCIKDMEAIISQGFIFKDINVQDLFWPPMIQHTIH